MSCGTQEQAAQRNCRGLSRGVLDRATQRRTDPVWLEAAWRSARVLVVDGDRALATAGPADSTRLVMQTADTAPAGDRFFLGVSADGMPYFAVAAPLPEVPDAAPVSLRAVGHQLSDLDADLLTVAVALGNWHTGAGYDPRTGEPTTPGEGGWVRTTAGGRTLWPRTDPAMIVLVHDGVPGPQGRCLLAHKPEWPTNRYSCVAGYVDPGESVEDTVLREVGEEVGVAVHDVRYVTSQPWPFPRSLMLAYTALADPTVPVTVDGTEIADARWFRRADFDTPAGPTLPFATSVAYFLITTWLADR